MWRNAAKCGAFLAHFGPIRAILGCFEMRRNAAADPNAAHFGAFRRHARRIMQLSPWLHLAFATGPSAQVRIGLLRFAVPGNTVHNHNQREEGRTGR